LSQQEGIPVSLGERILNSDSASVRAQASSSAFARISEQEWMDFHHVIKDITRIRRALRLFTFKSNKVNLKDFIRASKAATGLDVVNFNSELLFRC
jgi:hypothetical protein